MAATKQQVEGAFTLLGTKLPNRGYFLDYEKGKPRLRQHTQTGDVDVSPRLTVTPMYHWLLVLLRGIELAQSPLPTSEKCPHCDGKLAVYESLPAPRWTYLCTNCEETGTISDLQEAAQSRGE